MVKIWGHRGACAYAPENTKESFRLAFDLKADGIEIDTHLTSDGVVAVSHDGNLKRMGGVDRNIAEMTWDEVESVDVSGQFSEKYGKCTVPELSEVLSLVKEAGGTINIELKATSDEFLKKVAAAYEASGIGDRIIFSSFSLDALVNIRDRYLSSASIALLFSDKEGMIETGVENRLDALHPSYTWALKDGNIKKAHEAGMKVNVWTVNDTDTAKQLISLGADAIITNVPDAIRGVL